MAAFTIGAAGLVGIPPGLRLSQQVVSLPRRPSVRARFSSCLFSSPAPCWTRPTSFRSSFTPFSGRGRNSSDRVREAPLLVTAPLAVTALLSVVFFVFPDALFRFYTHGGSRREKSFRGLIDGHARLRLRSRCLVLVLAPWLLSRVPQRVDHFWEKTPHLRGRSSAFSAAC